jgi:hypothetical protein
VEARSPDPEIAHDDRAVRMRTFCSPTSFAFLKSVAFIGPERVVALPSAEFAVRVDCRSPESRHRSPRSAALDATLLALLYHLSSMGAGTSEAALPASCRR